MLLNEPSRLRLIAATKGASLVGAPWLPWEVGNALVAGVRRRRINPALVPGAWVAYLQVPVRLVHIDVAQALDLAVSLGVYAYDAYVLEAARAERAPLLTLDAGLIRAGRATGLSVVELSK